jgi:hypothetical protein
LTYNRDNNQFMMAWENDNFFSNGTMQSNIFTLLLDGHGVPISPNSGFIPGVSHNSRPHIRYNPQLKLYFLVFGTGEFPTDNLTDIFGIFLDPIGFPASAVRLI